MSDEQSGSNVNTNWQLSAIFLLACCQSYPSHLQWGAIQWRKHTFLCSFSWLKKPQKTARIVLHHRNKHCLYNVVTNSGSFSSNSLLIKVKPVIHQIDDWNALDQDEYRNGQMKLCQMLQTSQPTDEIRRHAWSMPIWKKQTSAYIQLESQTRKKTPQMHVTTMYMTGSGMVCWHHRIKWTTHTRVFIAKENRNKHQRKDDDLHSSSQTWMRRLLNYEFDSTRWSSMRLKLEWRRWAWRQSPWLLNCVNTTLHWWAKSLCKDDAIPNLNSWTLLGLESLESPLAVIINRTTQGA